MYQTLASYDGLVLLAAALPSSWQNMLNNFRERAALCSPDLSECCARIPSQQASIATFPLASFLLRCANRARSFPVVGPVSLPSIAHPFGWLCQADCLRRPQPSVMVAVTMPAGAVTRRLIAPPLVAEPEVFQRKSANFKVCWAKYVEIYGIFERRRYTSRFRELCDSSL